MNRNLLLIAGLAAGLLIVFLLFDSAGTINMFENLAVYALGAGAGYLLMQAAIKSLK